MSAFGGVLDSTFGLIRDKHVVGSATLKRNVKIKRKKMDSFRKLTEINDLLAFSEDGKRCAYVIPGKTSKVYIYSLEKEACEREITLKDSELSWCEIQFVGNRYIAVRGCDYMFWYEI